MKTMPEVVVVCGHGLGITVPDGALRLVLEGDESNITLRISDLTRAMVKDLPPIVADLVEVATYVYAADLATRRGGLASRAMGRDWHRAFRFVVAVREPDHWNSATVLLALQNALAFLSDDTFEFEFVRKAAGPKLPQYLAFGRTGLVFDADEVVLFSGGLDSLAGAIEELSTTSKKIMLVSHRPSTKIFDHQKKLIAELRSAYPGRTMHIPVIANRRDPLKVHEFTQRTRSFLYTALASAIANLAGLHRVRFFENGIVSMNLPIAEQVVGARATRTTHPLVLSLFGQLLSHVLNSQLEVENPFIWTTKADVVRKIVVAGFGKLVADSVSCSHVHEMTREQTHCGRCSQCIDRRFGILSAGAAAHDPTSRYAIELLEGDRKDGVDRTMAEAFVRSRVDMAGMTDFEFVGRYASEIAMICGSLRNLTSSEASKRLIALHRRHGEEVTRVIEAAIAERSSAMVRGALPASSILMMAVVPGGVGRSTPTEIRQALAEDLPNGSPARRERRSRATPVRSRAMAALADIYPEGVPGQNDVSNGALCGEVADWLKKKAKPQVSNDTVLRAAGRRGK